MWMPDVNVLVYAHREDEVVHTFYRDWLEATLDRGERVMLSPLVAGGFLRVVTHPRVYPRPTPGPVALAAVEALLAHPSVSVAHPGARHLALLVDLCRQTLATGAKVADAQHAAVAIEHGAVWVTRDRDFAVFKPHGLRWLHLSP